VRDDERLELPDELGRLPERQVRRDAELDRLEPPLCKVANRVLREGLVREVVERRPAPESESLPQRGRRTARVALVEREAAVIEQPLEADASIQSASTSSRYPGARVTRMPPSVASFLRSWEA
jgi:hypothetical protein